MSKEKRTTVEVLGDTALDLGKLTFAGIVLAGIFDSNFNKTFILLGGIALCLVFMAVGVYFTTKKTKEKKL